MTMGWFRRKPGGEVEQPAPSPQANSGAPAPPVIRHVPGVRVEVVVTLPDGGKARSTHFARIGSTALGRIRVGPRNLALSHAEAADGSVTIFGDVAEGTGLPAFAGEAAAGAPAEWKVPLDRGAATVQIRARREDVPA